MFRITCIFFLFIITNNLAAQDCACTITEVENNTVTPSTATVGTVVTVSNADELRNAINAANSAGGNRTILLEDGIYPISSTEWFPYITASNMVFRSVSGNRDAVILTGTGMASVAPGTEHGIYVVGENITVADLTIREVGNHGIATQGDNLFVHNVRIQNTFEQMIKGNAVGDGADNGTVQCSLLEYPAGVGPQFYIGGLDIHGGNDWLVRDNVFKNIASPAGSLAEHAVHFWNNSANNTVERNLILNCDRGIGFGLGSSPNEGGIIRNNMIYNDGAGLFDDVGIGLETSPNTRVYHNTIFIDYQNAIEYRFAETTGVIVTNNLTNRPITARNGGTATVTSNVTDAAADWFADTAAGDLRPDGNQAAVINQAADLGTEIALDIDKTVRPQGVGFDIGAYEFPESVSAVNEEDIFSVFSVFPNPAAEEITVNMRFLTETTGSFRLLDNEGKQIGDTHDFRTSGILSRLDVKDLPAGVYRLLVTAEDNIFVKTVVIE